MKMEKLSSLLTTLFLSLAISSTVYAGNKTASEAIVTSAQISGAIGSVRNSSDASQFITCSDMGSSAICYGQNSVGYVTGCSTNDPTQLAMIRSLTDSSYLYIGINNGTCVNMKVDHSSIYEPKI